MFLYKNFLRPKDDERALDELEDVRRNVSWILETRRDSGYFLERFGLSDLGNRSPAQLVDQLRRELLENVRLYEPRLEVIDVEEDWDDAGQRTKLTLRARLRSGGGDLDVDVDLQKKRIEVKGRGPRRPGGV